VDDALAPLLVQGIGAAHEAAGSKEMAMSLPMDFSTALWWRSVPVWEWEALPPPEGDLARPGGEAELSSPTVGATDCAAAAASPGASAATSTAASPAASPGSERDGYRLVLKGYQISASLFSYPADSPLSRPWLRNDDAATDRRPRSEDADAAARAAQLRAASDDEVGPT
jgi:hypothetical protein